MRQTEDEKLEDLYVVSTCFSKASLYIIVEALTFFPDRHG